GYTCVLPLTTTELALVLAAAGGRGLALQFRTTSGTDGVENWLSADAPVLGEVAAATDGTALTPTAYLTTAAAAALYSPRAQGYHAQANATGNTTVTPATTTFAHREIVTFSGTARTSVVILALTARAAGDTLGLRLNLPAAAGIVVEVRNATDTGTLLLSLTSDGTGDDAALQLHYNGTAWEVFAATYPTL
ncbi:MAG: hypothetical protein RLZZ15_588, partial [Verrucomicrobiota bacterium]